MESKHEVVKAEKRVMEADSDESSTEEPDEESPRSVVADMKKKVVERVHSRQVLRIIEEDSHLGVDFIGGGDKENNNIKNGGILRQKGGTPRCHHVVVSITRVTNKPILPRSPLSGKNNVKKACTESKSREL